MRVDDIETPGHSLSALLTGAEFDENAGIQFKRGENVEDRIDLLCRMVAGKNVIHLGFCDHLPSIAARRAAGRWLHDHLRSKAKRCLGVDINAEAVEFVRDKIGVDDIACADITDPSSRAVISSARWDYLLIPEVLEHIGNPVQFLRSIVSLHGANIGALIITVPNAFRAGSFRNALRGVETINSDHRFYFTPYTIMKIAMDAGLKIQSLSFAQFSLPGGPAGAVKNMILRRAPMFSENLVLIASV